MSNETKLPTLGESRIRVNFNASGSSRVQDIKVKYAELVDLVNAHKNDFVSTYYDSPAPDNAGEVLRLFSLAQTELETSAMYAVKAVTSDGFPN